MDSRGRATLYFPYYLPVDLPATHDLLAMVTLDPLMGLAAFVLWHGVLAEPALAGGPAGLRARVPMSARRPVRSRLEWPAGLLWVLGSLVVGAATHLFWDAFTHRGRWGANHIGWLAAEHGPLPGYRWAQYASGVFGAVAIAAWVSHWWRTSTPASPSDDPDPGAMTTAARTRAAAAIAAGGLVGAGWGAARLIAQPGPTDLSTLSFAVLTRAIAGVAVVALALAVLWQHRIRA